MNDIELAAWLRSAGETPTEKFRTTLESELADELAGRPVASTATRADGRSRWWLKVAAGVAVVMTVAVAAVVRDRRDQPSSPSPEPTITTVTPDSTATPATTTAATTAGTDVTTSTATVGGIADANVTVSPDGDATSVVRIWVTGIIMVGNGTFVMIGDERNEYGIDALAIAAFQADGSLLAVDLRSNQASSIALDGAPRWTTQLPADINGRTLVDAAIGPDGNLYAAYQAATGESTFAAVATDPQRSGQVLGSWDTNLGTCDRCMQFYMRADGLGIEYVDDPITGDTIRTTPYVGPLIAGSFDPPLLVNTGVREPAPTLPAGYADPADPTFGTGQLTFFTVPNTNDEAATGEFWTVNALGTSTARTGHTYGTPDGAFWAPFRTTPDGNAITAIITSTNGQDPVPTLVIARSGGTIDLYRQRDDTVIIDYTEHDGLIYAVVAVDAEPVNS